MVTPVRKTLLMAGLDMIEERNHTMGIISKTAMVTTAGGLCRGLLRAETIGASSGLLLIIEIEMPLRLETQSRRSEYATV